MKLRVGAAFTLLLALAGAAAAQSVYRCGASGSYSATPCPAGAVEVPVADPRSEAQRREAAQVAQTESRLARQLEAQRQAREAAAARQGPAGIRPLPPSAAASSASAPKHRHEQDRKRKGHDKRAGAATDAASHPPSKR